MSTEYRLDIYGSDGAKVAEVTDFLSLQYTKEVNAPGLLAFTLPGDHQAIGMLTTNCQVEVLRRNVALGLPWTHDFTGLYRSQRRWYRDHELFEARCPGIMTMLSWRVVAWYTGTTDRSTFDGKKSETVMKTLVSYNAGSSATAANGRLRTGTISGMGVETDQARGNSITIACAYKGLLETLQDITAVGGGDFDVVRTGALTWEFRFYPGQLGTDRRGYLLFSLDRGNMADPEISYDQIEERTVALVAGQGEEADRMTAVRTGVNYSAANDSETFVDARDLETAAGLNVRGDARLDAIRARRQFSYRVLQTYACVYGVHYRLGDLVSARYGDTSIDQKIMRVGVALDESGTEQISVGMAEV